MANDMVTAMYDQMMAECRDMIEERINSVTADAIQSAIVKVLGRPQPAPQVSVAAPHVVLQPQVTVTAPENEAVTVNVDMAPVAKALATSNAETHRLLTEILAVLRAPLNTTVHREGPFISGTTQTRG